MQFRFDNIYGGYSGETVLENVGFEIRNNEKIAVIGRNGCGKTTLLRLISGELEPLFGYSDKPPVIEKSSSTTIGMLSQIAFSDDEETLEGEMLKVYAPLIKMKEKIDELALLLESDHSAETVSIYSRLLERFDFEGGYYYKKEYMTALKKFGFSSGDYAKKLNEFSGGQRTRIAFIRLLLSKPDVLLLDEPTNHLDVDAVDWLEEYLRSYKKAIVFVSHDRQFIDDVANVVYEIENKKIERYIGNYSEYIKQKELRVRQAENRYEADLAKISEINALADRFRYKATKAKMVQSRLKVAEKLESSLVKPNKFDLRTFSTTLQPIIESGNDVLKIRELSIGYDEDKPFAKFECIDVYKRDRLAVIGGNGTGKSTFMKTIVGKIPKLSGSFYYGVNVVRGYFDQQIATDVSDDTLFSCVQNEFPLLNSQEIRSFLGRFLFRGDDVFKPVNALSGGERVRLALCKLFLSRPNLLILDEPTNHMDILSKEALEKTLNDYEGTVIFVTHDRYFIKKLATKLIVFDANGATYYPDNYDAYVREKEMRKSMLYGAEFDNSDRGTNNVASDLEFNKERSQKSQYEAAKERRRLQGRLATLNAKIACVEAEIAELNSEYNDEANMSDYVKLGELSDMIGEKEEKLLDLLTQKDEFEKRIADLS